MFNGTPQEEAMKKISGCSEQCGMYCSLDCNKHWSGSNEA